MRHLYRYSTQTLLGAWIWIATIPLDIALLLSRPALILGDAQLTVRFLACDVYVLMVLVAAVAAFDASRTVRLPQLIFVPRHGYAAFWWNWYCTWLPLALARCAVLVIALTYAHAWSYRYSCGPLVLAFFVQLIALGWAIAAGSFIGRILPVRFASIIAALLMMMLGALLFDASVGTLRFSPLGDSGASISQIGLSFQWQPLIAQCILMLASGVLMLRCRLQSMRGMLLPSIGSILSIAVAFLLLFSSQYILPSGRFDIHSEPPETCTNGTVTVCVYREHSLHSRHTVQEIMSFVDALDKQGYDFAIPDVIEEQSRSYQSNTRSPWRVGIEGLDGMERTQSEVITTLPYALATPSWCASWSSEEGPSFAEIHSVNRMAQQLQYVASGLSESDYKRKVDSQFKSMTLPEAKQLMASLQSCKVGS